ncbi:hypothetical protein BH11ARM1_BH11ARM1_15320 [soil metagenome]
MNAFVGRHYETGMIINTLVAMGVNASEAMALGASGGIAFGYFVFEYTGNLPHVALLTRNTFSPFERTLDNLGIRRETRETTNIDKADKSLRLELDAGNPVLVWADMFSLPYNDLNPEQMWLMSPVLVVGQVENDFLVVDGTSTPFRVPAEQLMSARARIKKDRFRIMVLEKPDESRLKEGLEAGIRTCAALFLDKPPAGTAKNFGIAAIQNFAQMLTNSKDAKGWPRTFPSGPRLAQALVGRGFQPGVFDWIQTWGTGDGADRQTYAEYLDEASKVIGKDFGASATAFRQSHLLWRELAEAAMPSSLPLLKEMKDLKIKYRSLRSALPESFDHRKEIKAELQEKWEQVSASDFLATADAEIRETMAGLALQIVGIEEQAIRSLRAAIDN